MSKSIKKSVTAVFICCLMGITAFAGIGMAFPKEVSADDGWNIISPDEDVVNFKYKIHDYNPYYDGAEHLQIEFGLEYENVIFQDLEAQLTNKDTGQVIKTIEYENSEPTKVTAEGIAKKDQLLEELTEMTKQTEVANYYLSVSFSIYQTEYRPPLYNAYGSGFGIKFSVLPRPIKVVSNSANKPFDGQALVDSGYTYNRTLNDGTASLLSGDKLQVAVSGTQTEVGESENTIDSVKVVNGAGIDVSHNYALTTETGKLTVTAATKTRDKEKTDGTDNDDKNKKDNNGTKETDSDNSADKNSGSNGSGSSSSGSDSNGTNTPQTGDPQRDLLWISLIAFTSAGVIVIVSAITSKRHRV